MSDKPIFVTQPHLPPLEEFLPLLEKIWDNKILTNGGPMHQQLEQALCDYLGVKHIALFNNGTIALMLALKALGIEGEVITTPYSFVATAHSLVWGGIKPVFVDVDPSTLNLDPTKIEEAITPQTTAIMPVHCYGTPCDVEAIHRISERHGLKVIYDAAHAFGVKDSGGSILRHGDLSVLSFHATKVFNTFEGGAIVCPNAEVKQYIDQLKNFGFADEITVISNGMNGKMSEINAAFGLLQLTHIDEALQQRQSVDEVYRRELADIPGIRLLDGAEAAARNYSYFPILIEKPYSLSRDQLYQKLKENNVFARRYFYPLISDFQTYQQFPSARPANLPVAQEAAKKVLCLPIHTMLSSKDVQKVIDLVKGQ